MIEHSNSKLATNPIRVVVFDRELQESLMLANIAVAERVAFLVGYRRDDTTFVLGALFPPLLGASPTHATFDMKWETRLKRACRDLGLAPEIGVVGWMHSHPRMSIFLSSVDEPTAAAFLRSDPLTVAVVVNPFSQDDPIGAFAGNRTADRILVEFRSLLHVPDRLVARVAALCEALPEWPDVVLPRGAISVGGEVESARTVVAARLARMLDDQQDQLDRLLTRVRALESMVGRSVVKETGPLVSPGVSSEVVDVEPSGSSMRPGQARP